MNKNIFLLFSIIIFLSGFCYAEDGLEDFANVDQAWEGQDVVTDKDFEDAIKVIEEKKNKTEKKQRLKLIKRIGGGGTSLHSDLSPDSEIKIVEPLVAKEDGLLLNIPVNIIVNDFPLEKGFYKVIAKKEESGDLYLWFYQSRFFKGKVRASETNEDYGEDELNFVRLIPYNDSFVKIIYGSIEYNVYAYVRFY